MGSLVFSLFSSSCLCSWCLATSTYPHSGQPPCSQLHLCCVGSTKPKLHCSQGVYTLVASCSSASPSISSASSSATSSLSTSSTASFSHPRCYCAFSQCHRYCVSNKAT